MQVLPFSTLHPPPPDSPWQEQTSPPAQSASVAHALKSHTNDAPHLPCAVSTGPTTLQSASVVQGVGGVPDGGVDGAQVTGWGRCLLGSGGGQAGLAPVPVDVPVEVSPPPLLLPVPPGSAGMIDPLQPAAPLSPRATHAAQ
jgi:hypothetical protein